MRGLFIVIWTIWLLASGPAAAKRTASCDAAPALQSAARYLEAYDHDMTFVTSEEHYVQREVRGDAVVNARDLRATLAFVNLGNGLWTDFRDVFEVDGRAVRSHDDRVLELFVHPAPDELEQARRVADESARYNLGPIARTVNTPMLALAFVRRENQRRSIFSCESVRAKGGVTTVVVRFVEDAHPRLIVSRDDAPARGQVSIQADTGRIADTELWFDSAGVAADITVAYGLDAATGKWVPTSMDEHYDIHQAAGAASARPATGTVVGPNGSEGGFGEAETIEGHATYSHIAVAHVNVIIK